MALTAKVQVKNDASQPVGGSSTLWNAAAVRDMANIYPMEESDPTGVSIGL